jgi:hypothetical protein
MDNLTEAEKYKASFIYNAIKDGWAVSMKANGEFEFTRPGLKSEYLRESYSNRFLATYGLQQATTR